MNQSQCFVWKTRQESSINWATSFTDIGRSEKKTGRGFSHISLLSSSTARWHRIQGACSDQQVRGTNEAGAFWCVDWLWRVSVLTQVPLTLSDCRRVTRGDPVSEAPQIKELSLSLTSTRLQALQSAKRTAGNQLAPCVKSPLASRDGRHLLLPEIASRRWGFPDGSRAEQRRVVTGSFAFARLVKDAEGYCYLRAMKIYCRKAHPIIRLIILIERFIIVAAELDTENWNLTRN